jgi:hypothetical protein
MLTPASISFTSAMSCRLSDRAAFGAHRRLAFAGRRCGARRHARRDRRADRAKTVARFTGRDPFATFDGWPMAKQHMVFSSPEAAREPRRRCRSRREGLRGAPVRFSERGLPP